MAHDKRTRQELLERIARLEAEPASCPCECHKPKHAARPPHADAMIGRP
jgi:hypothetical protein